ncbi:MAG: IS200/IS605 family transposase [Nanoarchaeota archaeon]|nr:IS200/IS605 family transposase [Nanoarchaeota archaeon]MBU1597322.1 IS200/IS605 family transposase [Nanoarchaeota archaeon]MBU2441399.1 IS200/IS605 family transposase [Nanoarchaeota archaeon]
MSNGFKTLKRFSHKVGKNFWHIEFATKYRYKMFGKFKQHNIANACIRKVCKNHKIRIHTLYVMPDHVHMMVTLPHNITDSKALMLLKGGSAYLFFKNHPKSRLRLPRGHLWSAGGCAVTVGYNEFATVDNYIRNQAEHHALA